MKKIKEKRKRGYSLQEFKVDSLLLAAKWVVISKISALYEPIKKIIEETGNVAIPYRKSK